LNFKEAKIILNKTINHPLDLIKSLLGITRPSITQLVANPAIFLTTFPLEFTTGPNDKLKIVVPTGFVTDLASIPRIFWWWQSPHEVTMAPAIIHDFLYWQQPCSKEEADAVMYLALLQVGMSKTEAFAVDKGIRTAEALDSWNKNTVARRSGERRFFSDGLTMTLIREPINPKTTLSDIQKVALVLDENYLPDLNLAEIQKAAAEALNEYNKLKGLA